jgi:tetratricopeptide (TPR) repeat protein
VAQSAFRAAARRGGRARARRLVKQASVVERLGGYPTALRLLSIAEREPNVSGPMRVELLLRRSSVLYRRGRLRSSLAVAADAERSAVRSRNRSGRARALLRMEMVASQLGLPERFDYGMRAVEAFEGLSLARDRGHLFLNLGVTAKEADDWVGAIAHYQAAAAAYLGAGDRVGGAFAVNNQADILSEQGRLDAAKSLFLEARRIFTAAGQEMGMASTESSLGRIALLEGRLDDSAEHLHIARDRFGAVGVETLVLDTRVRLVEHALIGADPQHALAMANEIGRDLDRFGDVSILPISLKRLAGVATVLAGNVAGVAMIEDALTVARDRGVLFEVGLCLDALDQLHELDPAGRAELNEAWRRLDVIAAPRWVASNGR